MTFFYHIDTSHKNAQHLFVFAWTRTETVFRPTSMQNKKLWTTKWAKLIELNNHYDFLSHYHDLPRGFIFRLFFFHWWNWASICITVCLFKKNRTMKHFWKSNLENIWKKKFVQRDKGSIFKNSNFLTIIWWFKQVVFQGEVNKNSI